MQETWDIVMSLKKVAIIYNDDMDMMQGREHNIASWEGVIDTAKKVEDVLERKGIAATLIPLRDNVESFIKTLKTENADVIFNLCEGAMGKSVFEMNVAAMLELFSFRFTGSGSLTLGMALHKARTKDMLYANNIPTTPYLVLKEAPRESDMTLIFPLIVKPVQEDASIGIDEDAVVKNMAGLKKRVDYVFKNYKQPAIVEEYIDGREFNISIIGNNIPRALPVSEIDFSQISPNHPKICTYDAKWAPDSPIYMKTPPVCPADISRELELKLFNIALKAYSVLGCRDYARIDMRMGGDGIPKILEVNPNPDISPDAGFARSAMAGGISYSMLIFDIVKLAFDRHQSQEIHK